MNRLRNMRTYLVGAMDRVKDGGIGWRDDITPFLKEFGVVVINPCKKPIGLGIEDEQLRREIEDRKQAEDYDKIREDFGVIRTVDLRFVDVSDFLIANIDTSIHACGSYEEITTANKQKKPILIRCEQGKKNAPNWLFYMLPHQYIFSSFEEMKTYLTAVDKCKEDSLDKRWYFFDFK